MGHGFWLRFNLDVPGEYSSLAVASAPLCLLAYGAGLIAARVYRQVWSYTGLPELRELVVGIVSGGLLCAAGVLMLRLADFPRSVLLLHPLLSLFLLSAARLTSRIRAERRLVGGG